MGELAGKTEQANELAKWLRGVTRGVTVKQLEKDFGYVNKNRWTPFRNGTELPPEDLLERVVGKYTTPAEREARLSRGKELLRAARRAEREQLAPGNAGVPGRGSEGTATAVDALLRLTASQEQLIEAERKLRDSELREAYLEKVVSELRRKQARTEAERDRAKEEARAALAREAELLAEYGKLARNQLERARRSRVSALELRLTAEEKVVRDQSTVRDSAFTDDEPSRTRPVETGPAELPGLERIADALHLVDEDLTQHERELSALQREIGQNEGQPLTGVVPLRTVRGQLAGTPHDVPTDGADASPADASFADEDPDRPARPESSGRSRWPWAGVLAGATALLLLPLVFYESGTAGLGHYVGSLPHKATGSPSAPSYSWEGVSSQDTLSGSEGLQATFTPASPTTAVTLERRFRARLVLSVPEDPDDRACSDRYVGVSWAITADGGRTIAEGSLVRKNGESAAIDDALPYEPRTISLTVGKTVSTRDRCAYTLRLERPAIHYSGWWGRA